MSFASAPVTKGFILSLGVTSVVSSIFDIKYYFNIPLSPHITRDHQLWRLLVHHCAFTNSSEVVIGTLLLFNTAVTVERFFGSTKFASFLAVSGLLSTILEFAALILGSRMLGLSSIPAGPFGIIFAILYQFYRIVPPRYSFKVMGITFTDKALTYLFALQLLFSQPPLSITPSILGLLSSYLYRSNFLRIGEYRLPLLLQRISSRFLLPMIGSTRVPRRSSNATEEDEERERRENSSNDTLAGATGLGIGLPGTGLGRTAAGRTAAAARPTPTTGTGSRTGSASGSVEGGNASATGTTDRRRVTEVLEALTGSRMGGSPGSSGIGGSARGAAPSQDQIQTLEAMFPNAGREAVLQALQRSENDANRAVEILLEQG